MGDRAGVIDTVERRRGRGPVDGLGVVLALQVVAAASGAGSLGPGAERVGLVDRGRRR